MTSASDQKTISILGSTGSIGRQTLDVLTGLDRPMRLGYISSNTRIDLLEDQTRRFRPYGVVVRNEEAFRQFRATTSFSGPILCGDEGLQEAAAWEGNDMIMSSLVGFAGVLPTLAALQRGTTVALANKETLVSAGNVITAAARRHGAVILPVDSEHSAIMQCLAGEASTAIDKMILTASGGPFRETPAAELRSVTRAQALRHPNWSMGAKITIDSATLMNKGFELIEARWLFDIPVEKIDVVVHPQSIIHSMVEFCDGSVKAQLGLPDMKVPILYALSYPERVRSDFERLDLAAIGSLTFYPPDYERFPCLRLAFEAIQTGGTAPAVVNAANELAVSAFLAEKIAFYDIPRCIEEALRKIDNVVDPSLDDILAVDAETRGFVSAMVN